MFGLFLQKNETVKSGRAVVWARCIISLHFSAACMIRRLITSREKYWKQTSPPVRSSQNIRTHRVSIRRVTAPFATEFFVDWKHNCEAGRHNYKLKRFSSRDSHISGGPPDLSRTPVVVPNLSVNDSLVENISRCWCPRQRVEITINTVGISSQQLGLAVWVPLVCFHTLEPNMNKLTRIMHTDARQYCAIQYMCISRIMCERSNPSFLANRNYFCPGNPHVLGVRFGLSRSQSIFRLISTRGSMSRRNKKPNKAGGNRISQTASPQEITVKHSRKWINTLLRGKTHPEWLGGGEIRRPMQPAPAGRFNHKDFDLQY